MTKTIEIELPEEHARHLEAIDTTATQLLTEVLTQQSTEPESTQTARSEQPDVPAQIETRVQQLHERVTAEGGDDLQQSTLTGFHRRVANAKFCVTGTYEPNRYRVSIRILDESEIDVQLEETATQTGGVLSEIAEEITTILERVAGEEARPFVFTREDDQHDTTVFTTVVEPQPKAEGEETVQNGTDTEESEED